MEDPSEVAALFCAQLLLEGKVRSLPEMFKNIDAVTSGDIQKVAKEIFVNEKLNLAIIGPYKDEAKFEKILKL